MWLQFLSSCKSWINSFCSSSCALWRWFRYKQQKSSIDWQWREYETLRLYSTVLCYKNVCFEIMNWKYEFIDITLILTLNDDIVVTLNDLVVI
jgi:hypothetical protein